jgi:hypothetical protein
MRASLDSHQQRLRLRDLRHFGRRREPFERWGEDRVGFNVSPRRLIEPGEREGRQELITPCALNSCPQQRRP